MSEYQIFKNKEFGEIRTILDENNIPLFCGSDVAKALGYGQPHKAVNRHCRYGKFHTVPHPQNEKKKIKMIFIPESDMYRLILKSKLVTAQKFERWVFEEVLPSIRKHGAYFTKDKLKEVLCDPQSLQKLLNELLNELNAVKPKAKYFDRVMEATHLINFRSTAKLLGVKPLYITHYLLENKYIFRNKNGYLEAYQEYIEKGYFEIKEFIKYGHPCLQTLVTLTGRQYLLNLILSGEMKVGEITGGTAIE